MWGTVQVDLQTVRAETQKEDSKHTADPHFETLHMRHILNPLGVRAEKLTDDLLSCIQIQPKFDLFSLLNSEKQELRVSGNKFLIDAFIHQTYNIHLTMQLKLKY